MNSIYALVDPRNNELRYIGKSKNPQVRLRGHCYGRKHTHSSHWVQSLKSQGLYPRMLVIESGLTEEEWPDRERFWIAHYRSLGADLTNITDGGHHVVKTKAQFSSQNALLFSCEVAGQLAHCKELHGTEYKVLFYILSRLSFGGRAFLNQSAIAEALGMPKSQVSVAIKRLTECRVISKEKKDGVSCYEVHHKFATMGNLDGKAK